MQRIHTNPFPHKNQNHSGVEHVTVVRSAHVSPSGTFPRAVAYIINSKGCRLIVGRDVNREAARALKRNAEATEREEPTRQGRRAA